MARSKYDHSGRVMIAYIVVHERHCPFVSARYGVGYFNKRTKSFVRIDSTGKHGMSEKDALRLANGLNINWHGDEL